MASAPTVNRLCQGSHRIEVRGDSGPHTRRSVIGSLTIVFQMLQSSTVDRVDFDCVGSTSRCCEGETGMELMVSSLCGKSDRLE